MIAIGVVTVHFEYPRLARPALFRLASSLFQEAQSGVRELVRFDDPGVVMELEEASLRVRTKIVLAASAVVTFLSNYGSVRQGAIDLSRDVYHVGSYIVEKITRRARVKGSQVISTRRSATLARRIERIMRDVERGRLNTDQAMNRLMAILDPDHEGVVPDSIVESLETDLRQVREQRTEPQSSAATQQALPLVITEDYTEKPFPRAREGRTERPWRPRRLRVQREGDGIRIVEID